MARTPIHPGEHLAEELKELGIPAAELAPQIKVPVNRVTGILNGQRSNVIKASIAQKPLELRNSARSTRSSAHLVGNSRHQISLVKLSRTTFELPLARLLPLPRNAGASHCL